MNSTKYVVLNMGLMDEMFVFSSTVTHAEFVSDMGAQDRVVSAGFLSFDGDRFEAYGKSISLGVGVGDNDTNIANRILGVDYF